MLVRKPQGLAIAALIVGIVAFFIGWMPFFGFLVGMTAVVLGIIAIVKKQPKGLAVTGLVLGGLAAATSIVITIVAILMPPVDPVPSPKPTPMVTQTPTPTPAPTEKKPVGIEIPEVAEMAGDEADDLLQKLGFKTEFDAGEQTVIVRSNWIVTGTTPAAGEFAGKRTTVTIHVEKPKAAPVEEEMTSLGLTGTTAWALCDQAGNAMFPYGFRIHITGIMADAPQGDTWFMKATTTTENEFGNKRKDLVMECYVTGTDDAPVISDFLIY